MDSLDKVSLQQIHAPSALPPFLPLLKVHGAPIVSSISDPGPHFPIT